MSSYVLCSECYTWSRSRSGYCEECSSFLNMVQPDPTPEQLRQTLGDVIGRLGMVRLRRSGLPSQGLLYATTRGLFFAPHRTEHVSRYEEYRAEPSWWMHLMGLFWSPLHLAIWLFSATCDKQVREIQVPVSRPQLLTADDSEVLPELLMNNPGAFFVPLNGVRGIEKRRGNWIVDRGDGKRLILEPICDLIDFGARFEDYLASPEWRGLSPHR